MELLPFLTEWILWMSIFLVPEYWSEYIFVNVLEYVFWVHVSDECYEYGINVFTHFKSGESLQITRPTRIMEQINAHFR